MQLAQTAQAALEKRHWWHETMSRPEGWPLARACFSGFETDEDKSRYLVTEEKLEKPYHYAIRKALSQFLGATPGICERLVGQVFQNQAEVDYDESNGLARHVEAFAYSVDGAGTTLEELLEENAEEALQVGICGFLIEKPKRPDDIEITNREQEEQLGLLHPRVMPFRAEEIVNWSVDATGRLEWVVLERRIIHQPDPMRPAEHWAKWMVVDRERTRVWAGKLNQDAGARGVTFDPSTQMLVRTNSMKVESVRQVGPEEGVEHGAGQVPFVPLYGRRVGPMMGRSPLAGAIRADLAAFNQDSGCTFSEWLHGKPLFVIKSGKELSEISRGDAAAFHLDPGDGEDAGYKSTPTEGFAHSRAVVEARKLDAYRMAGADPLGVFDGGSNPESGRAKRYRFSATEERVLARLAAQIQDTHYQILEVAARLMSPEVPELDEQVFTGHVRYQSKFDLADADEVIDQYAEAGYYIDSESWHKDMRKRIALLIAGEVSPERRALYEDEIEAAPFRRNLPAESVETDVDALKEEAEDRNLPGDNHTNVPGDR